MIFVIFYLLYHDMNRFIYNIVQISWIIGILLVWLVSADDTNCWEWIWQIPMETYATGIIYWCDGDVPVISIYSGRWVWITLKANNEWTWVVKIWSWKNIDAYWGLYQRWNSYPFPSIADNTSQIISGNTPVSTDWYWPQTISWFYYSEVWIKQYKRTSNDNRNTWWWWWDWNWNMWWYSILSTTAENRQWPCPNGYHIPSVWEWNMLLNIRWTNYKWSENIATNLDYTYLWYGTISYAWIWNKFSNDIMLPFIGNREQDTSIMSGNFGFYWTSSPSGSSTYARRILIDENSIQAHTYNTRGSWRGIRCFRDSYIKLPEIFNITLNNDGEYVRSGDIETWNTIPKDIIIEKNLTWLTKEWYTFSWWIISGSDEMFDVENDIVTTWMTLNALWNVNQYTITFDTDWWTRIDSITADYWTWITVPSNPTKNWYKFIKREPELPNTMPLSWITIKAIWEKLWSSGWGGRTSKISDDSQISPDPSLSRGEEASSLIKEGDREAVEDLDSNTPMDSSDKSSEWQEILSPSDSSFTKEQKDAYEFAKWKWITTMPTINDANMNWKLTRIAMAKMLSQYAINVLWQKPANIITPKFNDVTDKQNSDYDDWITLAYQLWIMWQNMPNNNFRPNDEVTRAEFATALSRMAYWTSDGEYKWTWKYYIHHMEKLVKEWIITKDDPNMKELRWYVMIMLMRSSEK